MLKTRPPVNNKINTSIVIVNGIIFVANYIYKNATKMNKFFALVMISVSMLLSSCLIKFKSIKSGSVGVKQTFGKYKEKTLDPGLKVYTIGTRMLQVNLAPTKFIIEQPTRLSDGSLLSPTVNIFVRINPDNVVKLMKEQYSSRSRRIDPNSFAPWIKSITQESIAKTSIQYEGFEQVNIDREDYKRRLLANLDGRFKNYFIIEDLTVPSVHMNRERAGALDDYSVLTQKIVNMDLEIQLAQKQITLDSLRAVSERRSNEVINPSLTPEILEKERIENNQMGNGNQTIIIEK